jgi:hypothetical protein
VSRWDTHYLESNSARSGQVARRATAGKATRQVSCLVKETLGMSLVESLGELLPMSSRRVKPSHPFLCYLLTKETRILTHLETIMNFRRFYTIYDTTINQQHTTHHFTLPREPRESVAEEDSVEYCINIYPVDSPFSLRQPHFSRRHY